jgi:hypothetical protein
LIGDCPSATDVRQFPAGDAGHVAWGRKSRANRRIAPLERAVTSK